MVQQKQLTVLNIVLGLQASLVDEVAFVVTGAALVATFVETGTLATGAEVETAGSELAILLAVIEGKATFLEIETVSELETRAEVEMDLETDAAAEVAAVVPLLAAFQTARPGIVTLCRT